MRGKGIGVAVLALVAGGMCWTNAWATWLHKPKRPVCPPVHAGFFGYYPTCWRVWPSEWEQYRLSQCGAPGLPPEFKPPTTKPEEAKPMPPKPKEEKPMPPKPEASKPQRPIEAPAGKPGQKGAVESLPMPMPKPQLKPPAPPGL